MWSRRPDNAKTHLRPKSISHHDWIWSNAPVFRKGETTYSQGDAADSLFVIQKGSVKLSVKSRAGREATLDRLTVKDFVGKDSMAGRPFRTASARAITDCSVLRIGKETMARALLLLAHYDGHGEPEATIPKISHETLAEMVGTTRSRVCFFMNRFKDSGFIYYEQKGQQMRVHRTLLAFCGQ